MAGLLAGALLAGSSLAPASARADLPGGADGTSDDIAALVARVAPDVALAPDVARDPDVAPIAPVVAPGGFAIDDTRIPGSAAGSFTVGGAEHPLSVSMPRESDAAHSMLADDGSVVLPAESSGVDVVAQALGPDALRIHTVIESASAPHVFTYDVANGYELTQAADGSFWAYRPGGDDQMDMYRIHEPWARDAAGRPVETRYEIRGNSLVQTISTDEHTVFPVVADPTWEWYLAAYGAGFNKRETRQLASAGAAAGFCGLLPGAFAAACGVLGAQWFLQAQMAADAGECVFVAVVPAPVAVRYDSHNCT